MLFVQGEKCVCAEEEKALSTGDIVFGDCDSHKTVKECVVLMWLYVCCVFICCLAG